MNAHVAAHINAPQELNIYQAAEWWRQLQQLLQTQTDPVIDCSQMIEIDGAGLQLLLVSAQQVNKSGGTFSLSGLKEPLQQKLSEFGVLSNFTIHE